MIDTGLMDWEKLVDRMAVAPAGIGGYEDHGSIAVGRPANFIVVNPKERWTVDRRALKSKSSNTPFDGRSLPAKVVHAFYRGVQVLSDSQLTGSKYE